MFKIVKCDCRLPALDANNYVNMFPDFTGPHKCMSPALFLLILILEKNMLAQIATLKNI